MIRVLICASSPMVLTGLVSLIEADPLFEIAGASGSLAALDEHVNAARPDVVVLVLDSYDEDPFTGRIEAATSAPAWVLLADDLEHARAIHALQTGVRALLPRDAAANEIRAAIHAAAAGLIVLRPETLEGLQSARGAGPGALDAAAEQAPLQAPHQAEYHAKYQTLTPREIEVLRMLAEGLGNKEIAWRLKISEHTVKFHISAIFTKLDASSRTEAVTLGIRLGLIML